MNALNAALEAVETFKTKHTAELAAMQDQIDALKLFPGSGPKSEEQAPTYRVGNLVLNTPPAATALEPEQRKAWANWLSGSGQPLASMTVNQQDKGGYFVPPEISRQITKAAFETSPVRQLARVVQIDADAFEEPVDKDEATASWVGETQSRAETDTPDVGMLRVPLHEIYANPGVSQKLLNTSGTFQVDAWLNQKIAGRFNRRTNTAFVSGDGNGKPIGFLNYSKSTDADATRAWGTLQYTPSGASGAFDADPDGLDAFEDMIGSMKAEYRDGAAWLMNRLTYAAARKLKDSNGQRLIEPNNQVGGFPLLCGYPVVLFEDMPAMAADSYSVAFANMQRGYIVVDHRNGVSVLRDPFTNKPFVHFYATSMVGGDVTNFEAIKLMKFATS
jgi:HK97 family phage major capsid protein